MASSSASIHKTRLRKRPVRESKEKDHSSIEEPVEELIQQTSSLSLQDPTLQSRLWSIWTYYASPLILTVAAAFVRLYGIGGAQSVTWDEAHFGKFGSYYLQHTFYFDVHPPLGKLLVALSGYLAGFDGSFLFDSGSSFPEGPQFTYMRIFNAMFGILCTPIAYFTALELQCSIWTSWLVGLSVAFEMLALILSRFILLDLMLIFFTSATFLCLIKVHNLSNTQQLISMRGALCILLLGLSIGGVCSVKLVGLFVTTLVGLYTIYDLLVKFHQTQITEEKYIKYKISYSKYAAHWVFRVIGLILVPFAVYIVSFMIHFKVLYKSGPGDGSISTLLQASLEGNSLKYGPRSVAYGSMVTFRSQGLSPNILHSHGHLYPEGSRQQQITTYGYKDSNNEFMFEFDLDSWKNGNKLATLEYNPESPGIVLNYSTIIKDGDRVRLKHKNTGCFLHSHSIAAAVSNSQFEVSCYGGLHINDSKDNWVVEIQSQEKSPSPDFQNEDPNELHPVSTRFRLRHEVLGCYLATTGNAYPAWGFQQGEIVCKYSLFTLDKSTWWNIEDHENNKLETPEKTYVAPTPRFWNEFILLNYGMMASNNALVPDSDHFDSLSSEWWEWPILKIGLRMGTRGSSSPHYFLMCHVFVTLLSTVCLPVAVATVLITLLRGQRQDLDLNVTSSAWNFHLSAGILPILGWVLHYLPFVIMARVTYLHHYVPAQYFGIFVYAYLFEYFVSRNAPKFAKFVIYGLAYSAVLGGFWYFHPFALGMVGSLQKYEYLRLFPAWDI